MFFEIQNLCFSYYKNPLCLKDVNISLRQGDKVVFVASSEMGKTTLLKVLSSFETTYFGKILLNDQDLKQMQDSEKNFSLILSDPIVFKNKTIKQNLDYFCDVNNLKLFSDEQIVKFLKIWNIDKQLSDKMSKLSLFEKRKFSIARALLKNPAIIFLDDQFENLDECEQSEMEKIYFKLFQNKNLTIVSTVGEVAFKILFTKNYNISIDRFFYLCDSIVKEYRDYKDFCDKRENFDVFKFVSGFKTIDCEIFFEHNKYKLALNDESVAVVDLSLYKTLAVLKLGDFESESCTIVVRKVEFKEGLSVGDVAKMLKNGKAFLYSKLGGEKLI